MADEGKEIERIYIIPLTRVKQIRVSRAAPKAVKTVRSFLTRHMKVTAENVWIDDSLNKALWAHGKYHIPSSIRVRAVKFEDGVVEASIPELGLKKSRRELLKEEREKKEPILRREEAEEQPTGEGATGAEAYDVTPSAEGEVKIKKKKAPKEEEKTEKKPKTATEDKKKPKKKTKTEEKPSEETPAVKKRKTISAKKTEKTASSKTKRKKSPASKKEK